MEASIPMGDPITQHNTTPDFIVLYMVYWEEDILHWTVAREQPFIMIRGRAVYQLHENRAILDHKCCIRNDIDSTRFGKWKSRWKYPNCHCADSVVTNTCSQYLNTNTNTTGFESILNTILNTK